MVPMPISAALFMVSRNWNIVYIFGLSSSRQNKSPTIITDMLRSPSRPTYNHQIQMDSSEQVWPDETIVVLPETPRVRLSPRRKMNIDTPGWPPAHVTETIRMYHDSDSEDQEVHIPQFTMNPEFIESIAVCSIVLMKMFKSLCRLYPLGKLGHYLLRRGMMR